MKLKSFQKINYSTKTVFTIFEDSACTKLLDRFTVDYINTEADKLNASILKRMSYESITDVCYFDVINGTLYVDCYKK